LLPDTHRIKEVLPLLAGSARRQGNRMKIVHHEEQLL
jgi:hypothetical protein